MLRRVGRLGGTNPNSCVRGSAGKGWFQYFDIASVTTEFLRRIFAPVKGLGGSLCPLFACSHCHRFPIEDFSGLSRWSTMTAAGTGRGSAGLVVANTTGEIRTESLLYRTARVAARRAPPNGACENLVCVLELLPDMTAGGVNLVYALKLWARRQPRSWRRSSRGCRSGAGSADWRAGEAERSLQRGQTHVQQHDVFERVRTCE